MILFFKITKTCIKVYQNAKLDDTKDESEGVTWINAVFRVVARWVKFMSNVTRIEIFMIMAIFISAVNSTRPNARGG